MDPVFVPPQRRRTTAITLAIWATAVFVFVVFSIAYSFMNQINPANGGAALSHALVLLATAAMGVVAARRLAGHRKPFLFAGLLALVIFLPVMGPATSYGHGSSGRFLLDFFLLLTIGIGVAIASWGGARQGHPNPGFMASFVGAGGFILSHAVASFCILATLEQQATASRVAHLAPAGWLLPALALLMVAHYKSANRNRHVDRQFGRMTRKTSGVEVVVG